VQQIKPQFLLPVARLWICGLWSVMAAMIDDAKEQTCNMNMSVI
jgi:hypothetical protein